MKQMEVLPEYGAYVLEYGIAPQECRCICFSAGETLIHQGGKGDFLYFIAKGIAKVLVYSSDGKSLSLSYSVSEGVLGEVELMSGGGMATASVVAETELVCLAYPFWKAKQACGSDIRFVNRIARDLALKLSRSTGSFLSASFASAEIRTCAYLIREAEEYVYRGTLAKAAAATGTSYRHLQRVMIQLCKDGVLRKEPDGYHILDFDELRRRAHA